MGKFNLQRAWNRLGAAERVALAERLGTTVGYLSQIANGHRVLRGAASDDDRRPSLFWLRLLTELDIPADRVSLVTKPQPVGRRKGDRPAKPLRKGTRASVTRSVA